MEDDWSAPDRQAEDEARALPNAAMGKQYPEPALTRRLHYGQWAEEEMEEWNRQQEEENGKGGNIWNGITDKENGRRRKQIGQKGEAEIAGGI